MIFLSLAVIVLSVAVVVLFFIVGAHSNRLLIIEHDDFTKAIADSAEPPPEPTRCSICWREMFEDELPTKIDLKIPLLNKGIIETTLLVCNICVAEAEPVDAEA